LTPLLIIPVYIREAQLTELRDTHAGVKEQPEDGTVAHRRALCQKVGFPCGAAGQQQTFPFLRCQRVKHAGFQLGKGKVRKRCGMQAFTAHEPLTKGPHRACVGLHCAGLAKKASGAGHLGQERHPAVHLRFRDLAKQETLVLVEQIVLEQPQGILVPL